MSAASADGEGEALALGSHASLLRSSVSVSIHAAPYNIHAGLTYSCIGDGGTIYCTLHELSSISTTIIDLVCAKTGAVLDSFLRWYWNFYAD